MDGCYLCSMNGCDDCMFITKAHEYFKQERLIPHIKINYPIKSTDKRLKVNK